MFVSPAFQVPALPESATSADESATLSWHQTFGTIIIQICMIVPRHKSCGYWHDARDLPRAQRVASARAYALLFEEDRGVHVEPEDLRVREEVSPAAERRPGLVGPTEEHVARNLGAQRADPHLEDRIVQSRA